MAIGERQKNILSLIVEEYIRSGEAIGSKTICSLLPYSVSSATVRNDMARLTEMGLIEQRHTSGGRVPSQAAYRYYVNELMIMNPLEPWEEERLDAQLSVNAGDADRLLADCTRILARSTGCAAFYTKAAADYDTVSGVELIPLGNSRAMIVMLTSNGVVKSSVCRIETTVDERFRKTFYRLVAQELVGTELTAVTTAFLQSIAVRLGDMMFGMVNVLVSLAALCGEASKSEIHMDGETNLLAHDEFGDSLLGLLSFLTAKEQFKNMVNSTLGRGNEKEIYIGRENMRYELSNTTMLISKYRHGKEQDGVIGLIGPTRLDYKNLIPRFDYITSRTSQLLTQEGNIYG